MIECITIADIATYGSTPQRLEGLSLFNYFFGSNATGKTTIGRIIFDEDRFPTCVLRWGGMGTSMFLCFAYSRAYDIFSICQEKQE